MEPCGSDRSRLDGDLEERRLKDGIGFQTLAYGLACYLGREAVGDGVGSQALAYGLPGHLEERRLRDGIGSQALACGLA